MKTLALFLGVLLGCGSVITPCAADTYVVKLDRAATSRTMSGRLMIFFITEQGGRWRTMEPRHAPFFSRPQPIGSVNVESLVPGQSIEIDTFESIFPPPDAPADLDRLAGTVRVQAVLDMDETMRSHNDGPGNVYSQVVEVELTTGPDDRVELVLLNPMRPSAPPETTLENIEWVEVKSELLSAFYGRDVYHRAGVAFPLPYFDKSYPQRDWPAIYEIPGYGGRHFGAAGYAQMFHTRGIEEVAPMAVTIVLDPDSPLGHHGFVDSPNHGPRGTALVRELIPYLEKEFRLVSKPEARLLTGHSSGGWSSLWLQLRWPDVFGGCWSSAPDPIDFSAFQMTNLYEDESMYVTAEGEPTPSMRYISGPNGETTVSMTVREEALMEWAMHPRGGSGQQWDAWEAMFSRRPRGRENLPGITALPRPMFDAETGKINRNVVEHWSRFDITKMVAEDWEKYGPIVTGRIRLVCGELDSFYLNRAVEKFKAMVREKAGEHDGPGYVRLVQFADHGNIRDNTFVQTNEQMRAHLREHGLHEW